jgi:hypothetical protein
LWSIACGVAAVTAMRLVSGNGRRHREPVEIRRFPA